MKNGNKILITGSDGFIGSFLMSDLHAAGHKLYPFSDLAGHDVSKKGSFSAFTDKGIDVVFHLAGKTFVPDSWDDPRNFYNINTFGTQNVLDFCKKVNARLIYVSAYVYGMPEYLPIDEKHPVLANNPYAHSKWLAEELCRFYSKEFGIKIVIFRPFNIYGEGQNEHFLIPSIIKKLKEKGRIEVKNIRSKRDYLYISDFIKALILAMDYGKDFSVFNIGSGFSYSVKQIIETVIKCYGKKVEWSSLEEERKNDIPETVADIRLIKKILGWKPKVTLKEGISRIVNASFK